MLLVTIKYVINSYKLMSFNIAKELGHLITSTIIYIYAKIVLDTYKLNVLAAKRSSVSHCTHYVVEHSDNAAITL